MNSFAQIKTEAIGDMIAVTINANRVMDLKNGIAWNDTQQATFRLAFHPNFDVPNLRDTSINVFAGYRTTIRLHTIQLESDESVQHLDLEKRKCRFQFENDNLTLFNSYSRYFTLA